MPETRKHRVQARDQIDQAIFAALGEPVLANQPGAGADETASETPQAEPTRHTLAASPFVSGGAMGQFTFHASKPRDPGTH